MAKIEEKAKVGRPKLAEEEEKKQSWISIGACVFTAVVMIFCGSIVLAGFSPREYFSLKAETLKGQALLEKKYKAPRITEVIKANGKKTLIIPVDYLR